MMEVDPPPAPETTPATPQALPGDSFYAVDETAVDAQRQAKPWTQDATYFKRVAVSPAASTKMLAHAQRGCEAGVKAGGKPLEVMGLLLGYPDADASKRRLVVTDALPLPVTGFETSVVADDDNVVNYMIALSDLVEKTRKERLMGWYHSHPFDVDEDHDNCFFSSTDLSTQLSWQNAEDPQGNPFLAIVLDPLRSAAKNSAALAAFRAYPPAYTPPANQCPDGEICANDARRVEVWGSCWHRSYQLARAPGRVEVLANQEAERRKHPDAPVLQFDLAVELDLALRDVVRRAEAHRIKEAHRRENTRKFLRVSLAVKRWRRLLSTDREHEELLMRRQLLRDHAGRRDHAQAPVLQLLRLHLLQLRRIRRLQPERIEAQVARLEIGPNLPRHAALLALPGKESRCLEAEDRKDFRNRDREHHRRPELLERGLLEREVSRHVDVAAEERVKVLADQEAERRKHPDAPVLQFDLTVELDLALRDVVRRAEAHRIEEAHRRKNTRKFLRVSLAVKRRLLSTDREHEELL